MGFGFGQGVRTDRGSKRHNNAMVAHVWNAQSETAGQSGNGNFYFRGRTLYSYGTHYVVGIIMPDGTAFLNGDSSTPTTNQHISGARGASRNRPRAVVADLTAIADTLDSLAEWLEDGANKAYRANWQGRIRSLLRNHSVKLAAPICEPGEWPHMIPEGETREQAGAYLAALVGLPAATWPKIAREAAKARSDKAAADKRASDKRAAERAVRLADMSDSAFRDLLASQGTEYSDGYLRGTVKELAAARSLALHAKRGPLAAKSRLATLRARLARARAAVETFGTMRDLRLRRSNMRRALAEVRTWRDMNGDRLALSANYWRHLCDQAEVLAARAPMPLRRSAANLADAARIAMNAVRAEDSRKAEAERERREADYAERKAKWLSGEYVGRLHFDAPTGGAALRIVGDTLETSHGAQVPLEHAVKAFRFIKLCRERGETFQRNGRTIRVGHFQVDRIESNGDFVAGCHSFTWPEVERVARIAGVFDCAPSADAIETNA